MAFTVVQSPYETGCPQHLTPDVDFAHNDADAIRSYVTKSLGFRERNIIDLRDASLTQLNAVFGRYGKHEAKAYSYVRPGKSDLVVFYSGHGVPGLKDNRGYLLPVNADPDLVEHTSYPIDVMLANLAKINIRSTTTNNSWLARGCPLIAKPEHGKDAQHQFDTAAVFCWRIEEAVFADRRIPAKEQS